MMIFFMNCLLHFTVASNFISEENIKSMEEEVLLTKCVGSFINLLYPFEVVILSISMPVLLLSSLLHHLNILR